MKEMIKSSFKSGIKTVFIATVAYPVFSNLVISPVKTAVTRKVKEKIISKALGTPEGRDFLGKTLSYPFRAATNATVSVFTKKDNSPLEEIEALNACLDALDKLPSQTRENVIKKLKLFEDMG